MKSFHTRMLCVVSSIAVTTALTGVAPALAQSATPKVLDNIVVTATKREESLQTTSIAITALSAKTLADRVITTAMELNNTVPNLLASPTASASANSVSFNIRGIGQVDFINTIEPGVGVYLDGVYIARTIGASIELADIDRVEVLRGPQGTLFGRNATGGAVSIVTAKPSFDGLFGEASLTPSAFTDDWRPSVTARASVNVPLSDKVAARFNLLTKHSDGWGKNNAPGTGEGLGEQETYAGRAAFLFQVSDDWQVLLAGDASTGRGTIAPMVGVLGPAIAEEDPLKTAIDAPTYDDMDVYGVSLTADGKLGDAVNIRSITAYRHQDGWLGQDSDGSTLQLINQGVNYKQHQFSQEVQLFGDAFEDRLKWLVGGYYFEEDGTFLTKGIIAFTPVEIDTFSSTKSYAAFGNLTYEVADGFNVVGGVRYTHEKKFLNAATRFGGMTIVPASDNRKTYSKPTFKAGVEYFPAEEVMLYAMFSQGFRSGGYNGRPFSPADLVPFEEETNDTYELGFKAELFDNTLRLNGAVFYSEYKNIQLTAAKSDPVIGVIVVTDNAGRAELPGAEAEFQWVASDALNIYGNVGYLDNDGLEPKAGFTLPGDTLPLSSRWNTTLGFDYTIPMGGFEGRVGADWSYRSSYFQSIDNSPLIAQAGFHLINARFSIAPADADNWDLTFFAKNLTNKQYRVFGQDSGAQFGVAVVTLGQPREVGAALRYRF